MKVLCVIPLMFRTVWMTEILVSWRRGGSYKRLGKRSNRIKYNALSHLSLSIYKYTTCIYDNVILARVGKFFCSLMRDGERNYTKSGEIEIIITSLLLGP